MLAEQILTPAVAQFAEDVRSGLSASPKWLPSKYFYDAVGSSLFDTICFLPEYGLTRADERVLRGCAPELAGILPLKLDVAELGSGSGRKTRYILDAVSRREPLSYYPIEISAAALATCERELNTVDNVDIKSIQSEYLTGLSHLSQGRVQNRHLLVLFLGSTIGNFERPEDCRFLREVRQILKPGDYFLLGADLLKPLPLLLAAYDDPIGVTAAFNLNLLARINRELGADFDIRQFDHVASFNSKTGSIEMHLRSRCRQYVTIPQAECMADFAEGETIWTESSHKYSREELVQLAANSGFTIEAQWIDAEWPFAETLLRVK